MSRAEAEKKFGFVIYQGGVVPGKELRIVEIENLDVEACGGTHVDNTKEVEEIFVFNNYKIQDGVLRLEFVAGNDLCTKIRRLISQKEKAEKQRIARKMRAKEKKKELEKKAKELAKMLKPNNIIYIPKKSMSELKTIAQLLVKDESKDFIFLISDGIFFGKKGKFCRIDLENLAKKSAKAFGGNYGKTKNVYSGGGPEKTKGRELEKCLKNI